MQSNSYGGNNLALYREWAARQGGGGNPQFSLPPQQTFAPAAYPQPYYEQAIQPTYGYSPYAPPVMQIPAMQMQREAQMLSLQTRLMNARRDNLRYKQELGRSIIQQPPSTHSAYIAQSIDNGQYQKPVSFLSQAGTDQRTAGSLSARNYQQQQLGAGPLMSNRMTTEDRMAAQGGSNNNRDVPTLKLQDKSSDHNTKLCFSQDDDFDQSRMQSQLSNNNNNPFHQRRLNNLNENLNQVVEENKKAIENDKTKLLPKAKQQQQEKKNANYQARQDIESLLKKQGEMTKMPLWRHRLQGNMNPPKESIMGGKSLFRTIALSVIGMLIGPARTVFLRKAEKRDNSANEFVKTLQIVTEGVDDWMSKMVQLPIASIIHDDGVDFDPKESFVNGSTTAFRNRMIQLKVRLRAILEGISSSGLPPPHIISYLVTLIDDGNYFPEDYLYEHELRVFEFDRLGATRDMLPLIPTGGEELYRAKVKEVMSIPLEPGESVQIPRVNAVVVKLFLINFLLIRTLIARLVLSPWQFHICKQPNNRYVRKGILNLRILGSVLYEMFRKRLNHSLPLVMTHQQQLQEHLKLKNTGTSNDANMDILSSISQKHDGIASNSKQTVAGKGVLGGLLKAIGVDTTPGYEDFQQGSIEFKLLRPRLNHYETMNSLHMMLMSSQSVAHIDTMINDWAHDMLPALNTWMNELVLHVVQQHYARRVAAMQSPRPNPPM